jgi:hypothetical protein
MSHRFAIEDSAVIAAAMDTRFVTFLRDEHFEVSGRVEATFVEMNVVLADRTGTFRYAMDFRAALIENGIAEAGALDLLADFAEYYLDQYFEGGRDLLMPLDFQPYDVEDKVVFARGDITNPSLEKMAEDILAAGVPLTADDPRHRVRKK